MNRLLCAITLAGFACTAGAQSVAHAQTFAAQEGPTSTPQSHAAGSRSFNDVLTDMGAVGSQPESRVAAGVTSSIPEPQSNALLLAGLAAVVFVATRRRQP